MGESSDSEKKIIVDEDWKTKVQAEKKAAKAEEETADQDVEQEANSDAEDAPATQAEEVAADTKTDESQDPIEFPPTNFSTIATMFASQAAIAMGHFPHPATGKIERSLEEAKYYIDLVSVLEEKTKGNLDEDEEAGLTEMLHQLRMGFVAAKNDAGK